MTFFIEFDKEHEKGVMAIQYGWKPQHPIGLRRHASHPPNPVRLF
jgi:hypothetical protein